MMRCVILQFQYRLTTAGLVEKVYLKRNVAGLPILGKMLSASFNSSRVSLLNASSKKRPSALKADRR